MVFFFCSLLVGGKKKRKNKKKTEKNSEHSSDCSWPKVSWTAQPMWCNMVRGRNPSTRSWAFQGWARAGEGKNWPIRRVLTRRSLGWEGSLGGPCTTVSPALSQSILDYARQDDGCYSWWEGAGQPPGRWPLTLAKFYCFGISETESNKWPTTSSQLSLIRIDNLWERTCTY